MTDYKKLWFKVCEEKNELQLENRRLEISCKYLRTQFELLERLCNKLKWRMK